MQKHKKSRYKYHAIIVLANLMDKDGVLNEESKGRMNLAIARYKAGDAPYIITTGWEYRDDSDIKIADSMRNYAVVEHNVDGDSVICDYMARDTVGDAIFTKANIVIPHEWTKLLVVTTDYHTKRTEEIFRFVYGKVYDIKVIGAVSNISNGLENNEKTSLDAFHNTFKGIDSGDDRAIFKRLTSEHPFYNGKIYPKV